MNALTYTVGDRTHIVRAPCEAPFYVLEDEPSRPEVVPVLLPYSHLDSARSYARLRGAVVLEFVGDGMRLVR